MFTERSRNFVFWLAWTFLTWISLAGAAFGLTHDLDKTPGYWWLALTLPAAAALCTCKALKAASGPWTRAIFWCGTTTGFLLVAALLQGQHEVLTEKSSQRLLIVAAVLPVLASALGVIWARRKGELKSVRLAWPLEIFGGVACLAALALLGWRYYVKTYVDPLRTKAESRWAEIGYPMDVYEKSLHPVPENVSLRELTRDLKPFGVVTLYKTGSGPNGGITLSNTTDVPQEIIDCLVDQTVSTGDSIKLPPAASATLEAKKQDFDQLYSAVLQREAPVWSYDPEDGFFIQVPNFLTMRKLSQWIMVDALHRLELGDSKAAANAVSANLLMTRNLGQQPILVSNMIRIAIEGLLTRAQARLPAEPDGLKHLAEDAAKEREQMIQCARMESWNVMHTFENYGFNVNFGRGADETFAPIRPLPAWLVRRLWPLYSRSSASVQCSNAWLFAADSVAVWKDPSTLMSPDLGESKIDEFETRHTSYLNVNWGRAWLRLNLTLVLREQTELIRIARAKIQAGGSGDLGEYDSVIIPGSKWKIHANADAQSFTLELSPRPKWVTENTMVSAEYWLLPLDGSKSWPLQAPAK